MRLCRIKVQNFRCIDHLEIRPRNYTSLIGPNNAGKSSLLRAIEIFLNQVTPSVDEWRKGHEKEPIIIEAEFDELLDWERVKPGVSSLVHDNKIVLRLRVLPLDAQAGRKKIETIYECMKQEESIEGWGDNWSDLDPAIKTLAENASVTGRLWRNGATKEKVRQLIREQFPDRVTLGRVNWTAEGISIPAAFQQALPQAQLIPAIRNAEDDGAPGSGSSFGLLLKSIILPAVAASEEYQSLMKAVEVLENKLRGEGAEQLPVIRALSETISEKISDLIKAKVSLGMDPPDAEKFIGSNTLFRLDDGTPTRIGLQGHGLQRALVFAMLEVLATQRAGSDSSQGETACNRQTVLLFEEPELFIHPHLMRRFKDVLVKIANRTGWQVIITTHSPFLVDLADDRRSLVIHRRKEAKYPPTVTQLDSDPLAGENRKQERERLRAVLNFHPTVCEAFFAKNVVLVEGDTELAILVRQPALYALAGVTAEMQRDTTIVSCAGKWTIIPIAKLLRAFNVPVRAIYDTDRKKKTLAQLKQVSRNHPWRANKLINKAVGRGNYFAIEDRCEDLLTTDTSSFSPSQDKPYRAWKRVGELCDGKTDLNHIPRLKALVDFAFGSFASINQSNEERISTPTGVTFMTSSSDAGLSI